MKKTLQLSWPLAIIIIIAIALLGYGAGRTQWSGFGSGSSIPTLASSDSRFMIITLMDQWKDSHSLTTAGQISQYLAEYMKNDPDQEFVTYVNQFMKNNDDPCWGIPQGQCQE